MQSLDMRSYLLIRWSSDVIPKAGVTDKVGEHGGNQYLDTGKSGERTFKDGFFCAIDDLIIPAIS
jgi:hypothetical protein